MKLARRPLKTLPWDKQAGELRRATQRWIDSGGDPDLFKEVERLTKVIGKMAVSATPDRPKMKGKLPGYLRDWLEEAAGWKPLGSKDPRKKLAMQVLRAKAGVQRGRVTSVRIANDGETVEGAVFTGLGQSKLYTASLKDDPDALYKANRAAKVLGKKKPSAAEADAEKKADLYQINARRSQFGLPPATLDDLERRMGAWRLRDDASERLKAQWVAAGRPKVWT